MYVKAAFPGPGRCLKLKSSLVNGAVAVLRIDTTDMYLNLVITTFGYSQSGGKSSSIPVEDL